MITKCTALCVTVSISSGMVRHLRVNNARCRESLCEGRTFVLDYTYSGQSRQVKQQIVDMTLNGSGIRDTARVLHVIQTQS